MTRLLALALIGLTCFIASGCVSFPDGPQVRDLERRLIRCEQERDKASRGFEKAVETVQMIDAALDTCRASLPGRDERGRVKPYLPETP